MPAEISPVSEPASWWGRNWKWFVPAGCLALILVAMTGLALLVPMIFAALRQSDIAQLALERAEGSPTVQAHLGSPVEPRWWLSGNIEVNGASGTASLAIPLKGPRGKGTLYVEATKAAGRWSFDQLVFETESDERVDLLDEGGG